MAVKRYAFAHGSYFPSFRVIIRYQRPRLRLLTSYLRLV